MCSWVCLLRNANVVSSLVMSFRARGSQGVQGFAREGQESLAERFALRRVRVDERCDVLRVRLPGDGQLPLGDELADAIADQVHAHNGTVLDAHDLHDAGRAEDLASAVAGQV